jgi:hypothetical protein
VNCSLGYGRAHLVLYSRVLVLALQYYVLYDMLYRPNILSDRVYTSDGCMYQYFNDQVVFGDSHFMDIYAGRILISSLQERPKGSFRMFPPEQHSKEWLLFKNIPLWNVHASCSNLVKLEGSKCWTKCDSTSDLHVGGGVVEQCNRVCQGDSYHTIYNKHINKEALWEGISTEQHSKAIEMQRAIESVQFQLMALGDPGDESQLADVINQRQKQVDTLHQESDPVLQGELLNAYLSRLPVIVPSNMIQPVGRWYYYYRLRFPELHAMPCASDLDAHRRSGYDLMVYHVSPYRAQWEQAE